MREALATVWRNPYARLLLIGLGAVAGYLAVVFLEPALVVVSLAYFVAYLADPAVSAMARRGVPRPFGVVVVVAAVSVFVAVASMMLEGVVVHLARLATDLPALLQPLADRLAGVMPTLERIPLPRGLADVLRRAAAAPVTFLSGLAGALASELSVGFEGRALLRSITAVLGDLLGLLAAGVLAIYLLWDFARINRSLLELWPTRRRQAVLDVVGKLDRAVGGYVRGQLVVALSVGVLFGVGLTVLGIPAAAGLGFLTGLFYPVPVVGVVLGLGPALLVALGVGVPQFLAALALYVLLNRLEAGFLGPMIVGRATNLHPATVVVALIVGAVFQGLVGALMAVPVAAFLKLLYVDHYLGGSWYKNGT